MTSSSANTTATPTVNGAAVAARSVADILTDASGIRLDIGCGRNKHGPSWVGIDMRPLPGVDIVHDLEVFPWPLPDECVLVAICSHVVEHINPHGGLFLQFMDELWRVMKPDGEVLIAHPHGSSQGFLQDPTHCNAINETTWAYFDPFEDRTHGMLYDFYRPKPWRIKHLAWSPAANVEVALVKRRLEDLEPKEAANG